MADTPSIDPQLGFETYAVALADAIRGGQPAQFTVGIYGPWGSGKSSLLNAIAKKLADDPLMIPVLFDAWRYEGTGQIVVPLLHAIYEVIRRSASTTDQLKTKTARALVSIVRSLTLSMGPLSFRGADLMAHDDQDAHLAQLDTAFAQPYDDIRAISEALDGRRVVVLIDDLDRCSPDKVIAVLEAINLVMDIPGFVFVLALDYDVLASAVALKYPHASGHVFIEKMVQVPFRVPRLDLPVDGFLPQLIPGWTDSLKSLPPDFAQTIHDVATLGLEANPRQIKRLINSVLVLMNVARERDVAVDVRLLAALVGVQLRWPAEYRDFVDAVLADDENSLAVLASTDQPKLERYVEVFFQRGTPAGAFRPYVQLAQTVALSEVEPEAESRPAADVREENRQRLVNLLAGNGYQPGRTPDTYALARNPDLRVKIGKTVIRFEVKATGGRWLLGPSCLLTTEHSRAELLISDPHVVAQNIPANRLGETEGYISPASLAERNADVDLRDLARS